VVLTVICRPRTESSRRKRAPERLVWRVVGARERYAYLLNALAQHFFEMWSFPYGENGWKTEVLGQNATRHVSCKVMATVRMVLRGEKLEVLMTKFTRFDALTRKYIILSRNASRDERYSEKQIRWYTKLSQSFSE